MAEFYIKNENGEFVEADDKVEERFREKSAKIVSARLNEAREKETAKIKDEVEKEVREKTTDAIRYEVRGEVEKEFQPKIDELEAKNKELGVQIRRKTIAAEFGFKPEAEKYLGEGSDDDMRKEAENLKKSFESDSNFDAPEKQTQEKTSKLAEETGLNIVL